jgi:ribonuclease HI
VTDRTRQPRVSQIMRVEIRAVISALSAAKVMKWRPVSLSTSSVVCASMSRCDRENSWSSASTRLVSRRGYGRHHGLCSRSPVVRSPWRESAVTGRHVEASEGRLPGITAAH